MKEFFSNLDFQELWEEVLLQILPWVDLVTKTIKSFLNSLYQNILANPLLAGAILLALIGIPFFFLKTKTNKSDTDLESSSDTDGRLDKLMEEMCNFEINTPMDGSQKNYSESPVSNMEPQHEDNSVDFNLDSYPEFSQSTQVNETLDSDSMIELPSLIPNEEEASSQFKDQKTEDNGISAESSVQENPSDDLGFKLEDIPKELSDWSQISRSTLSSYDDTELTVDGIESVHHELDEDDQELTLDIPSEYEEKKDFFNVDLDSQIPEPAEQTLLNGNLENTFSTNDEEHKLPVADNGNATLNKEQIDNPVPSKVVISEKILKESRFPKLNSQNHVNHTRVNSTDTVYKELLESFILLKDQKR